MSGDEDKKKKKKGKKSEKAEEAPPAEDDAPPASAMDDEGGFDWMSGDADDSTPAADSAPSGGGGGGMDDDGADWLSEEVAAPAEGEAPADAPAEGEAPPPPPKKKPKFFVHWNRKKSRFYDYIFDYGENYYSGMVRYIDTRADVPRRMAFAERGMRSSLVRKSLADTRTENLLADVNRSIKNFELSQKNYIWEHTKKV